MYLTITHVPHPLWKITVTIKSIVPECGPDAVISSLCERLYRQHDPIDITDTILQTGKDICRIIVTNRNGDGVLWQADT